MNLSNPSFVRVNLAMVFFLTLQATWLSGQTPADAWQRAETGIVLLQNNGGLLPLQRLDTLRPAGLTLWMGETPSFLSSLSNYQHISLISPEEDSIQLTADKILAGGFNLLVAGVNAQSFRDAIWKPGAVMEKLFIRLNPRMKIVLVVFGRSELWRVLNVRDYADAILFVPEADFPGQSLAAQAIYGAATTTGRLEEDLSNQFRAGTGLTLEGGLRLRYSPPAALGLDSVSLSDSLRKIVLEGIREGAYPGAQLLVAKNGQVFFRESFGHHTYDSLRPVTLSDLYDFASITKISAGLPGLMRLYGEGKFDLDAPLKKYFPYFKGSNKANLTFRRMLSHNARLRASIPNWAGTLKGSAKYPWKKGWPKNPVTNGRFKPRTFAPDSSAKYPVRIADHLWQHAGYKKQIYKSLKKSPLVEKPGYLYSDLSLLLVPQVVSGITGQPFDQYLDQTFYRRLGAHTLGFNPANRFPVSGIVPTELDTFFRHQLVQGWVHDENAAMMGGVSGHAGLFGNANDLAKLMQMYLNEGAYGGEQLISASAFREFNQCHFCSEGNHRGIGFDKPLPAFDPARSYSAQDASLSSFGHSGFTGTFTWADPESGILIVFLSNRVYPYRSRRELYTLNIRQRLHQTVYDAFTGK